MNIYSAVTLTVCFCHCTAYNVNNYTFTHVLWLCDSLKLSCLVQTCQTISHCIDVTISRLVMKSAKYIYRSLSLSLSLFRKKNKCPASLLIEHFEGTRVWPALLWPWVFYANCSNLTVLLVDRYLVPVIWIGHYRIFCQSLYEGWLDLGRHWVQRRGHPTPFVLSLSLSLSTNLTFKHWCKPVHV